MYTYVTLRTSASSAAGQVPAVKSFVTLTLQHFDNHLKVTDVYLMHTHVTFKHLPAQQQIRSLLLSEYSHVTLGRLPAQQQVRSLL